MARRSVIAAQQPRQPQAAVQQRAVQPQVAQPPAQRPSTMMNQFGGAAINRGGMPAMGQQQAPPPPANNGQQQMAKAMQPGGGMSNPFQVRPDSQGAMNQQNTNLNQGLKAQGNNFMDLWNTYEDLNKQQQSQFLQDHEKFANKLGQTEGLGGARVGRENPPPADVPPGFGRGGPDSRWSGGFQPPPQPPRENPIYLPYVPPGGHQPPPNAGGGGGNPTSAPVPEQGSGQTGQTQDQQTPWVDPWMSQAEWEAAQGIHQGQAQPGADPTQAAAGSMQNPYWTGYPQGLPSEWSRDNWNAYWRDSSGGAASQGWGAQANPQMQSLLSSANGPNSSGMAGPAQVEASGQPGAAGTPQQAPLGAGQSPAGAPSGQTQPTSGSQQALASLGITPAGQPNRFDPQVLGLPNSPEFMRAEMTLMDELSRTMLELGIAEDQIPALVNQYKARFETDTGLRQQQTSQAMADRGLMGSSVASRAEWQAQIPESRRWRDYLGDVQSQYDNIAQRRLAAQTGYRRGMEGLLYDHASSLYDRPPSSVYSGNRDYYDPGGGNQPMFWADAPGGYIENAEWFNQPQRPEWYDPRDWARPDYWGTVTPSGPGR